MHLKIFKFLAKKKIVKSLSIGQIGEDGFANLLADGKETNVRLLIWKLEDVQRLWAIQDEIYNSKKDK